MNAQRLDVIRGGRFFGAALLGAFVMCGGVWGQTTETEPKYVIVTGEVVSIRCGAGQVWYPVGQVEVGDVLLADGESYGWLRVRYPDEVPALALVDEGVFDAERGLVRLTKASRLHAHQPGASPRDSWRSLLTEAAPLGAEYVHLETLFGSNGEAEGYLIAAPAEAHGYVPAASVRDASRDEIYAFLNPEAVQAEERLAELEAQEAAVLEEESDEVTNGELADAGDDELTEELIEQPVAASNAALTAMPSVNLPRQEAAASDEDGTAEVVREPVMEAFAARTVRATPSRALPTFEQLDSAFRAIAREPMEGAEIAPLLAEHRRLFGSLGESVSDVAIRRAVLGRIALLEIRRDLQKDLVKLAAVESESARGIDEMNVSFAAIETRRDFVAVGRLVTSSIYDGERLPLMYRLQTVDGDMARTIAYVAPSDEVDLRGGLGSIVGLEGVSDEDAALGMNIIRPTRIERLTTVSASVPLD